jgi:hypothetical protein
MISLSKGKPRTGAKRNGRRWKVVGGKIQNIKKGVSKMPKSKKKYQIVRTYSAGVFAGFIESKNKDEVVMTDARRLWYWDGAASLSQLAMEGVKTPVNCKFAMPVARVTLLGVIEILDTTLAAQKNIQEVPLWKR